ncbi:MAG: hypothetical protein KAJ54_03475 [Candidatus Aenigmarchaeota archaeon]|nr:hypothetical protein [Candidatus Aenigmarchaeota archaeon]
MVSATEKDIEYLCKDLFDKEKNSILLYGDPKQTLAVLKGVYDKANKRKEFLCSWHDASKIDQPMDFFEPILRLKFGDEYEQMREKSWFKDLSGRETKSGVFQLACLCVQDNNSKNPNERRLPVIFIDGIDELLFKMDYSHLDQEGRKKVLSDRYMEQPSPKGFGDCLRAYLHQTGKGIFYGSVGNVDSIENKATLGNPHYLFYGRNFRPFVVEGSNSKTL